MKKKKKKKIIWLIGGIGIALLFALAIIVPFFLVKVDNPKEKKTPSETESQSKSRCFSCMKMSGESEEKDYTIEEGYKFCIEKSELIPKDHYQLYSFNKKEDYDAFQPTGFEVEATEESYLKKIKITNFISYSNEGVENYVKKIEKEGFTCLED